MRSQGVPSGLNPLHLGISDALRFFALSRCRLYGIGCDPVPLQSHRCERVALETLIAVDLDLPPGEVFELPGEEVRRLAQSEPYVNHPPLDVVAHRASCSSTV